VSLKTFFIDIPSEKCAVQVMAAQETTVDEILFDCLVMFGKEDRPTRIAVDTPDNVVWPASTN
jgi:hypothetical protein